MKTRTYTVTVTNPEGEVILTTSEIVRVKHGGSGGDYRTATPGAGSEVGNAVYGSIDEDIEKLPYNPEDWGKEAN